MDAYSLQDFATIMQLAHLPVGSEAFLCSPASLKKWSFRYSTLSFIPLPHPRSPAPTRRSKSLQLKMFGVNDLRLQCQGTKMAAERDSRVSILTT